MTSVMQRYDPEESADFYADYYNAQVGNGMSVYAGRPMMTSMRGHGFGSMFAGLARAALPLLKRSAATAGKSLLRTGANVLEDVMAGKDIKTAAASRFKHAGKELLGDLGEELRAAKARRAMTKSSGRASTTMSGVSSASPSPMTPPMTRKRRMAAKTRSSKSKRAKTIFNS